MRTPIIGFLSIILIVLTSCSEEPQQQIPQDCPTYPNLWSGSIQSRGYDFFKPVFNPNNPYEFIYVRRNYDPPGNSQLRKRNLLTQEDVLITVNLDLLPAEPSWAKSGWIVYRRGPITPVKNIWKIKSDGTGLTQLTFTQNNDGPAWKPDGSRFVYYADGSSLISDADGQTLDTIPIYPYYYCYSYSQDDKILFSTLISSSIKMAIFDLNTQTVIPLANVTNYQIFEWMPDGINFVGNRNTQLWLVNTQTEEQKLIKNYCGDRYSYFNFSISPDGLSLLAERREIDLVDSATYEFKYDIVMMRIDGTHEMVLNLE